MSSVSQGFSVRPASRGCPNCGFTSWCLPAGLTAKGSKQFNDRIEHYRLVKGREYLHHAGSALTSLHVVHSGFLKTSIIDGDGHEQVTGFSMTGDLIGIDAIGTGRYLCNTIALEDSRLCGMRFADLEYLGRAIPALQHHFHRVMGAEIVRSHGIMLLLGPMSAAERLATFLLSLSRRFSARGYSGAHFRLPMTRQDIGSYLGLRIETVSRELSRFNRSGLIAIDAKDVEIKSMAGLQELIGDYEMRRSLARHMKSGTD